MTAFLSYSRIDTDEVGALTKLLDGAGVPYWIDRRDIPVSVPWQDELRASIRAASIFVVCETFSWHESTQCCIELRTAEELHKPILYIEVSDQRLVNALWSVQSAVAGLSDVDHLHTDLLLRSATWDREGRKSSALVSGALLNNYARVGAAGGRPLTSEGRDFLVASRTLARRRRRLGAAGIVTLVASLLIASITPIVNKRGEEQLLASAEIYSKTAEAYYRTLADPYDGLQLAADQVRRGDTGAFGLYVLTQALNVPLPDASVEVEGAALARFAQSRTGGDPAVINSNGQLLDMAGRLLPDDAGFDTQTSSSAAPAGLTAFASADDITAAGTFNGEIVLRRRGNDTAIVVGPDRDVAGPVTAIAIGQGARLVAAARDSSGVVDVYDGSSGMLYRRLSLGGPIGDVAISPDGRTLAAGTSDQVALIDIATGVRKIDMRGPLGLVRDIAWSADSSGIWAINGERRVSHWQWHTGRRLYDTASTWFVALSQSTPNGHLLAVTQAGEILRVEPSTGTYRTVSETGVDRVLSASFDESLNRVLLGTSDGLLVAHDVSSGSTRRIADDGCVPASTVLVDSGTTAIVACLRGSVRRIDLGGRTPPRELEIPYGGAGSVTAGRDGTVYIGAVNGDVHRTRTDLADIERLTEDVTPTLWRSISLSVDGRTLLLTGHGTGKLGHALVGRADGDGWSWYRLDFPAGDAQQSRAAAISQDGSTAAVGMADGVIHYFSIKDGNPGLSRSEVAGAVTGLSFADGGVVAVSRDGAIDLVEACAVCLSPAAMTGLAGTRMSAAEAMGLIPR